MHRLLERFSAFASTAVVFVYLGSLFLSTATFLAAQAIGIDVDVIAFTAFALAAAFEVHGYLSQRLTRFWFQARAKLDQSQPEWDAANNQFHIHLAITAVLAVFSASNSIAFWATVIHPHDFATWGRCAVLGIAAPAGFIAASFLTALQHDAAAMLQSASATMLHKTVKITLKQWQRRLERARKNNVNLAPIAAALMDDAHETAAARRLRIIDGALATAEGLDTPPVQLHNSGQPLPAPSIPIGAWSPMDDDFTWEGSDAQRGVDTRERAETMVAPARIAVARAKPSKPRRSGNTPRRDDKHAVEDRVRAFVVRLGGRVPSITELERGAGISASTASWWRRQLRSEMEPQEVIEA